MISFLAGIVGPKLARPLLYGAALLVLLPLVFALGRCDGARAERAKQQAEIARIQAAAERMQRAADQAHAAMQSRASQAISRNRKEVDDAVSHLPDRPTSDRQRARACLERVRQGATTAELDAAGCPFPAP
jgi:hypothetical protein